MATYLTEIEIAPGTFGTLMQNPQDRAEAVRPLFEAVGGKLHEYYVSVGGSTVFVLSDVPDEVSLTAIVTAAMAGGAVTSMKSTPVMTAADAVEAYRKASSLGYRPPST